MGAVDGSDKDITVVKTTVVKKTVVRERKEEEEDRRKVEETVGKQRHSLEAPRHLHRLQITIITRAGHRLHNINSTYNLSHCPVASPSCFPFLRITVV